MFTTPDWRRTQGVVRSTFPLVVPGIGARVEGLELRFEGGKIVDVKAEGDGADVIRTQLGLDEQASFLGEVALVDGTSRVHETGLVFHNTMAVDSADGLPRDDLVASGVSGSLR